MATRSVVFSASQVRDFNSVQNADGSRTLVCNNNTPDRLIRSGPSSAPAPSNYLTTETITQWRATFQIDDDNEVIPGSDVIMEYSIDNGVTYRSFYDDSNLGEEGYTQYKAVWDGGADGSDDGAEWIAVVANSSANPNGTGFMMADMDLARFDSFTTTDNPNAISQFSVCFTTGMRIETEHGPVAVEDLKIGDMVRTFDHGLQPVRFIYRHVVQAVGSHRPVVIEKGALWDNERFVVSQQHRIHTSALRLPDIDALIPAVELVNGTTIRIETGMKTVEYFHIMFDRHELIWSEGILSESWQPSRRNLRRDKKLKAEILSIFPEILTEKVDGSPTRPTFVFGKSPDA